MFVRQCIVSQANTSPHPVVLAGIHPVNLTAAAQDIVIIPDSTPSLKKPPSSRHHGSIADNQGFSPPQLPVSVNSSIPSANKSEPQAILHRVIPDAKLPNPNLSYSDSEIDPTSPNCGLYYESRFHPNLLHDSTDLPTLNSVSSTATSFSRTQIKTYWKLYK